MSDFKEFTVIYLDSLVLAIIVWSETTKAYFKIVFNGMCSLLSYFNLNAKPTPDKYQNISVFELRWFSFHKLQTPIIIICISVEFHLV